MDYQEYLKSDHWRDKRKEAILIYQTCVLCGSDEMLQVHHRNYNTLWRENPYTDLCVLCGWHHEKYHGVLPKPDLYWLKKAMEFCDAAI